MGLCPKNLDFSKKGYIIVVTANGSKKDKRLQADRCPATVAEQPRRRVRMNMEVVKYPDPRLREKCRTVTKITEQMRNEAREMVDIMLVKDGVGLAAIQVGLDYRMIVVRDMKAEGPEPQAMVLLNPVIVSGEGEFEGEEGCLSLPGIYANVVRALKVKVQALNLDGEEVEIEASEFYARVFQHEIDHLNGVLFIDKISPAKKISIRTQLKKLTREYEAKTAQD